MAVLTLRTTMKYFTFREFLESSTIHGLCYISTTRNPIHKIFWIIIVFIGFSIAGMLITRSFSSWEENPFSTSIQTFPISKANFPSITVCPPEGSHTGANYDLESITNISMKQEDRDAMLKVVSNI